MAEYELAIVGGGAAGFAAAIRAEELGAKAVMINDGLPIGGTCVNVGCVPSKQLLVTGDYYQRAQENSFRALSCEDVTLSFPVAIEQKDDVVRSLRLEKYVDVLAELDGVEHIEGRARFVSSHEMESNGGRIEAETFLIATGSSPWVPSIPGLDAAGYWTSNEALSPHSQPESLLVIGGRALGLEFAQMYANFGAKVTLLQRSERIIPEQEYECSETLRGSMEQKGVTIVTDAVPQYVRREKRQKVVLASVAGRRTKFRAEQILMATGRRPNTSDLNLDRVGVRVGEAGEVVINREMRTNVPHIYAAGDVRGGRMLETTAAKEGFIAAENAVREGHRKMDNSWEVPRAVFTDPQFATVGYTEKEFSSKAGVCACRTLPVEIVPKARIMGDTQGVVKMVIDPRNKRIMGVHIVSKFAADIIHEATLAVKNGLTIDDIIDTVHIFPTYSEALKLVAQSFYRDVTKLSCCTQ